MITGILLSMNNHGWGNNPEPGNDPKNNNPRGPQNGPPDLEEVWRDFNNRLRGVLGGKGGRPSGGGTPSLPQGSFGGGIGLVLGVLVVLWLASGFYILQDSERGVVLRFGRYHETTTAGLRWHLPYPFESHEIVNVARERTREIGYRGNEKNKVLNEALMLTNDEFIVNIQFSVRYQIKDAKQYLFSNRDPDEAVAQAAETVIREVVGKSKLDMVLYEARQQIAEETQKQMQEILDRYEAGIQVSVYMQSIQPPEQVLAAFDDANKAGQDKERQKNEGQAYANDVIPRAKGAASRLLEESEGYKQRIIATAEGDASRFKQILVEYNKAPEVTRTRMYLDTLQQVYANTSKVMVDAKGQGNLLYLPLDKLMAATAGAAAPSSGSTDATQNAAMRSNAPSQLDMQVPQNAEKVGTEPNRQNNMRNRERGDR